MKWLTLSHPLSSCLLPVVLFLFIPVAGFAQDDSTSRKISNQIKASYVYNFLKFVSFRRENLLEPGEVRLCFLGKGEIGAALQKINNATIPQGRLRLIRLGEYGPDISLNGCNALYLSESEVEKVDTILARINAYQVLTIGEFSPFISHGGLIELYKREDSIRFRINGELAKETEFTLAAQLIQLGVE